MRKHIIIISFFAFLLLTTTNIFGANYPNIVTSYNLSQTTKIKTNIPFTNGLNLPIIKIEGSASEGTYDFTLSLMLVGEIQNNRFESTSVSSSGGCTPEVWFSNENGKIVVILDQIADYKNITVSASADGANDNPVYFQNWSIEDSASRNGTQEVNVPYINAFKGYVGIGTLIPEYDLDVQGTIKANEIKSPKYIATGEGEIGGMLTIKNDAKLDTYARSWNIANMHGGIYGNSLQFFTADMQQDNRNELGESKFTIMDNGNVGIGSSNPSEKLEIFDSNDTPATISLKSNRNDATNVDVGRISAKQNLEEVARIGFPRADQSSSGYMTFWTKENNSASLTERMRISEKGNVGIGTTNPQNALDVNGQIYTKNITLDHDNTKIGALLGLYTFEYDNKVMDHFSSTWLNDSWQPESPGFTYWLSANAGMKFFTGGTPRMSITYGGNVGIGTTNPQNTLDVKGTIRATEIKVESVDKFADFVFEKGYKLPTLNEVNNYIQTNGHLKDIPSATEVKENGMSLVEMQVKLLQKVEELTLYAIEQQKRIEELEKRIGK